MLQPSKTPEIFEAVKWWQEYLPIADPALKLKAIHVYKMWRTSNSSDRRRYLSNFIDDTHKLILKLGKNHKNISPFSNWAFRLSYVLFNFYFILDTMYIRKNR